MSVSSYTALSPSPRGKQLLEKLSKNSTRKLTYSYPRDISSIPVRHTISDYAARQIGYRRCLQAEFPIFDQIIFNAFSYVMFFATLRKIKGAHQKTRDKLS